ncbi:hypothetical protein Agub_g8936 [Astrephomene gubernaculifera]|uniref:Methanethiol oxidase n=1 Tax=Astrephomene gubernaculifera TaxID=47775 RepID=A0AAD3DSH7_9CHLO|nr:hypothetical protein Agub_g8936 [Astrephomene gubernaculifera]
MLPTKLRSGTPVGCSRCPGFVCPFVALALLALAISSARLTAAATGGKVSKYLYAWAGAADPSLARDSLFVFSVRPNDEDFGKLLHVIETPYNGLEPHHCRPSVDGRWLACSCMLAVFSGLPSILFFSLANPAKPVLLNNVSLPVHSAVADEFVATPDGGFLVTMMGNTSGWAPGRVARYDSDLNLLGEYPRDLRVLESAPGFNPHGIGADFKRETMLTVDYLEPASSLVGNTLTFRNTARLWNLTDMSITRTYVLPKTQHSKGAMDAVAIGDTGGYYFTGGNGYLYYLNATRGKKATPKIVFDVKTRQTVSCILQPFRGGTRLLMAIFSLDRVFLLDTTMPRKPKVLDVYKFPKGAGGHVVRVSKDESLVAVGTYFVDEGAIGQIRYPGDCTVRFLRLDPLGSRFLRGRWPYSRGPVINFTELLPGKGGFRTHGVAFL